MPNDISRVIQTMLVMQRYPWEQGVCAQAPLEAGLDHLWIPMAYDAVQRQSPDGRLAMIGVEAPRRLKSAAGCGIIV